MRHKWIIWIRHLRNRKAVLEISLKNHTFRHFKEVHILSQEHSSHSLSCYTVTTLFKYPSQARQTLKPRLPFRYAESNILRATYPVLNVCYHHSFLLYIIKVIIWRDLSITKLYITDFSPFPPLDPNIIVRLFSQSIYECCRYVPGQCKTTGKIAYLRLFVF